MASKKTSKSGQSIKDLSPRDRQAKTVKGGRGAARVPVETAASVIARPGTRVPVTGTTLPGRAIG